MQLPFTNEEFFDLFAAYNLELWPALIALWTTSVVVSVLLLSARRPCNRWISALLTAHWAWSALAYHVGFFTSINPAAWVFAALFLVQAALFVRRRSDPRVVWNFSTHAKNSPFGTPPGAESGVI